MFNLSFFLSNYNFCSFFLFSAICNGICGSKHPHSEIYDTAQITFSITGKDEWIPLF